MEHTKRYRLLKDVQHPSFFIPKGELIEKKGYESDSAYVWKWFVLHPDIVENNTEWFELIPPPTKEKEFQWTDALVKHFVISFNNTVGLIPGVDPIGQEMKKWKEKMNRLFSRADSKQAPDSKEWEILEIKSPNGTRFNYHKSFDGMGYSIHSVKRLPDGEVFTVGDELVHNDDSYRTKIAGFVPDHIGWFYFENDKTHVKDLNNFRKPTPKEQEPIEDKKERVRLKGMWDLNNIYQEQRLMTGFQTSHPLTDEHFAQIKSSIVSIANNEPLYTQQQVEQIFNASREQIKQWDKSLNRYKYNDVQDYLKTIKQ